MLMKEKQLIDEIEKLQKDLNKKMGSLKETQDKIVKFKA